VDVDCQGFSIKPTTGGDTNQKGINFYDSNVDIHNCVFDNFYDAITVITNGISINVYNNSFIGANQHRGINIDDGDNGYIQHNNFSGSFSADAIYFDANSAGNDFWGNIFMDDKGFESGSQDLQDFCVNGYGNYYGPDVRVDSSGHGVPSTDCGPSSTIYVNESLSGPIIDWGGSATYTPHIGSAIRSANQSVVMLTNDTIADYYASYGMYTTHSNVDVDCQGFSIKPTNGGDTNQRGLWVYDTNVDIHDCVFDNFYYGLYANSASNQANIYNNSFVGANQVYGFRLDNADNWNVQHNNFSGSYSGDAVYLSTNCNNNEFWGNIFMDDKGFDASAQNLQSFCVNGYGNFYGPDVRVDGSDNGVPSTDCGPSSTIYVNESLSGPIIDWGGSATYTPHIGSAIRSANQSVVMLTNDTIADYYASYGMYTTHSNVDVDCQGFSIKPTNGGDTNQKGINFYDSNVDIHNCVFDNFYDAITVITNGVSADIYNNSFIGANQHRGINIDDGDNWNVQHNNFSGSFSADAIFFDANSNNNNFWGNIFMDDKGFESGSQSLQDFCVNDYGNYYGDSVVVAGVPVADCGPAPNGQIYVNDSASIEINWGANATTTTVRSGIYNSNNTIEVVAGSGSYSEASESLRDSITLDCNGATLQGSGADEGLYINGEDYFTVNNCTFNNFNYGIRTYLSDHNTIANSTFLNNDNAAIYLYYGSDYNVITRNNISSNDDYGIRLDGSSTTNRVMYNNITSNDFYSNVDYAIHADDYAENNLIWDNNFVSNIGGGIQAYSNDATNLFNVSSGGNYWDDFDSVGEGCNLVGGFCDSPYNVSGALSFDYLPKTTLIIFGANNIPVVSNLIVNSTLGTNLTTENITAYWTATDGDNDDVKNITNWKLNGESITILNVPFETDGINNITDYGSNAPGTVQGGTYSATGGYDGNGAFEFDGGTEAADQINFSNVDLNHVNYSIEVWAKFNNNTGQQPILALNTPFTSDDLLIGIDNTDFSTGNITFAIYSASDWQEASSTTLPVVGQWYHIVAVHNDTNKSIYINGQWEGADANAATPVKTTLSIGKRKSSNINFNGSVDEFKIYNHSLSAEQISALYNNRTDLIVSQETSLGENWSACVTPNDGTEDGVEVCSGNLTILDDPLPFCDGGYGVGNWIIDSAVSCANETINITGELIVNDGGSLTIDNVTFNVQGNITFGGNLTMDNSAIYFLTNLSILTVAGPGPIVLIDHTNITTNTTGNYYTTLISSPSSFTLNNSYLNDIGPGNEPADGLYFNNGFMGAIVNNVTFGSQIYGSYCIKNYGQSGTFTNINCTTSGIIDYSQDNIISGSTFDNFGTLGAINGLYQNNIFLSIVSISCDGCASSDDNTYLNNNLSTAYFSQANTSSSNYLIYNNSFGEIKWYINNYTTTSADFYIGTNIYVENNTLGLADNASLANLNTTAQLKFNSLNWTDATAQFCSGNNGAATSCNTCNSTFNCSYSNATGIMFANVTSFSNYTTNGSTEAAAVTYCNGNYTSGNWNITFAINCSNETIDITGDLNLGSGAILTLNNITLNAYSNIDSSAGTLNVQSSIIEFQLTTNGSSNLTLNAGSVVNINNSVLTTNATDLYWGFSVDTGDYNVTNNNISFSGTPEITNRFDAATGGLIYNNRFTNSSGAVAYISVRSNSTGMNISNNYFSNSSNQPSILFQGSEVANGVIVENNELVGIVIGAGNYSVNITNNTFYNNPSNNRGVRFNLGVNGITLINNNHSQEDLVIHGDINLNDSNTLIYSNSFGEIKWENKSNLTVSVSIALGNKIFVENNTLGIADDSGIANLNTSAQLTFYSLGYDSIPWLLKDGTRCDNTSLCNISYSAGTLYANVSSFSNYTTTEFDSGPNWSTNTTSIVSTYSSTTASEFNITWQDERNVSTVYLESNYSGTATNYSMNNITLTVYNYSAILPVGTYYWKSYANDSINQWNETTQWTFTIAQSNDNCDVVFNESSPLSFPLAFNASTNCTTAFTLYRNGTEITNNTAQSLGVGTYNFTVVRTDQSNYSNYYSEENFVITQATSEVNTTINNSEGNISLAAGTTTDLNCTLISGESNVYLYNNGSLINSGTSPIGNSTTFSTEGLYNITCLYQATTNYSASSETYWVNITQYPIVELVSPAASYANSSAAVINVTFECNATDLTDLQNISLYITDNSNSNFVLNQTTNITGISNSSDWALELGVGTYTWNCLSYDALSESNWAGANRTITQNYAAAVATPAGGSSGGSGSSIICGDTVCNSGETCDSCPDDCGICPIEEVVEEVKETPEEEKEDPIVESPEGKATEDNLPLVGGAIALMPEFDIYLTYGGFIVLFILLILVIIKVISLIRKRSRIRSEKIPSRLSTEERIIKAGDRPIVIQKGKHKKVKISKPSLKEEYDLVNQKLLRLEEERNKPVIKKEVKKMLKAGRYGIKELVLQRGLRKVDARLHGYPARKPIVIKASKENVHLSKELDFVDKELTQVDKRIPKNIKIITRIPGRKKTYGNKLLDRELNRVTSTLANSIRNPGLLLRNIFPKKKVKSVEKLAAERKAQEEVIRISRKTEGKNPLPKNELQDVEEKLAKLRKRLEE